MTHDHKEACCASCALDAPCESDCSDHDLDIVERSLRVRNLKIKRAEGPSLMARAADAASLPELDPRDTPEDLTNQILREIRAPVFEGKPFSERFAAGKIHTGQIEFPNPPRGYAPQIRSIRFCRGDDNGAFGPAAPVELAFVPDGTSIRQAELTINRGLIVKLSLVCYSLNGGGVTTLGPGNLVVGGPPLRVPYSQLSGKFDQLFWKVDLNLGPNPAQLVVHTQWVPVHECFPTGVTRRPFQDPV